MPLSVDELVGNKTAIKQLINAHNIQVKNLASALQQLTKKEGEIGYLRTSPFIAIIGVVVGAIGAVVAGIGVNLATANPPGELGIVMIFLGAALVMVAGLANVLFPFARRWFNREAKSKP